MGTKPTFDAETHDVEACYTGGHGNPYYKPYISCSCGFSVRDETWEDVGIAYDEHLKGASDVK